MKYNMHTAVPQAPAGEPVMKIRMHMEPHCCRLKRVLVSKHDTEFTMAIHVATMGSLRRTR